MKGKTFSNKGQNFKVAEIMVATGIIAEMGWTHFAAVKRPNGSKSYYANLVIVNDEIVHSVVVL
jgi:hypothetical protein